MTLNRKPNNLILRALPEESFNHLSQKLQYEEMPGKKLLANSGDLLEYAYFPDAGMVSGVIITAEGTPVEASSIGREGLVGINFVLDSDVVDRKLIAQIGGHGWSIPKDEFKAELAVNRDLSFMARRFALTLFNQTAHLAACNRIHTIEERCSRWLLLSQDRSDTDVVHLTQEFLSMMLGVQRSGVNIAMRTLQKAGLINLSRGAVTILDRQGLLETTCGCYRQAHQFFAQTMGFSFAKSS